MYKVSGKSSGKVSIRGRDLPHTKSLSEKLPPLSIEPKEAGPGIKSPISKLQQGVCNLDCSEHDRPYLEVAIYGEVRKGLLDSGSQVTVKSLCPLIETRREDIRTANTTLRTANGQTLEILGVLDIPYQVGKRTLLHPTVIAKRLQQDLLLGYDFWKAIGLQIGQMNVDMLDREAPLDYKCEAKLDDNSKRELERIVRSFRVGTEDQIGRTHVLEHDIQLVEGAKPFTCRPYFFSPEMEKMIHAEIDSMLRRDIIGPSKSPVCSPIVPVKRPDKALRLCLDSRKLNGLTVKDKYPIPNIPHMMSRIQKLRYISSIDLSKAFWQVPLSSKRQPTQFASAQELTAFIVPGRGLFEYKVMPFGLCNGPATQCRLMQNVFGHDLDPNVFVYVDDILIVAETVEQMLRLLREVANRLNQAQLTINLKKSIFFAEEVKYVGYVWSRNGVKADPEKIAVMSEYPRPKNIRELRRYLGMTGYYRRLIRNYSGMAAPLTDMLRRETNKIEWTEARIEAFEALRKAMSSAPVVATPDFDAEFTLQCDASDVAAGAALGQTQENREVVIAYYSHKWGGNEKAWGATEKEAAAVLFAIKYFRNYLWGKKFVVVTDAQALTHIKTIHTDGSSRLSRWVIELNNYDLVIKHRAGRLSVVPDAISRAVEAIEATPVDDEFQAALMTRIAQNPSRYTDYRIEEGRILRNERNLDDIGCFSHTWKEYIPAEQRAEVIKKVHLALCHAGTDKCIDRIRKRYFWPNLRHSVKTEMRNCTTCKGAKIQAPYTRVPMGANRLASAPFEMVALDHWGPVPRSRNGNRHLLVIVDIFTKYVVLCPSPNTRAARVAKTLEEEIFLRFNPPRIILSDNYRPMVGRAMTELLQQYEVQRWTIPFYHSQANPAERYVRTVSEAIRAMVMERDGDQRSWDRDIPKLQWAINTTKNKTSKKSPFVINFGREPLSSGADYRRLVTGATREEMTIGQLEAQFQHLRNQVTQNTLKAQENYRKQYNKGTKVLEFEVGEKVWRRNRQLSNAGDHVAQKLLPKFIPAEITRRLGPDTYEIRDEGGVGRSKIHANDLLKD